MNLTTYFLKHPVIAIVLNAMIVLIGLVCLGSLSVREYPKISFPEVTVQTIYPNAGAELIETSVTNILEDYLAGIEGLDTIASESKHGLSVISMHFTHDTSIDKTLFSIREAINLARKQLPINIKDPIVSRKTGASEAPFIGLSFEATTMDFSALTHYVNVNVKNILRSVKGVSSAEVFGQPYTYTIVLDPRKMHLFGVNADDVFHAVQRANMSLPVGKFQNEVPAILNSELHSVEDYENLVVKTLLHKNPVLLKEISEVSLESNTQMFRVRVNGNSGLCIAINKTNDANPLEVSDLVMQQVRNIENILPHGVKMSVVIDQADFVKSSVNNIISSILEAMIFVVLVVFFFFRNIRATLIPLLTIPVSLLGSFIFLKICGFSINIMTLMAMVLAVGLVVDDAIVMLENIHRYIEKGETPFNAAMLGAKEIAFAIVAMTITLASVYMPLLFISDAIGQLFTEFAITLAGSVFISGITALTLTPLMCAKILSNTNQHYFAFIDSFLLDLADKYNSVLSKVIAYKKSCLFLILAMCLGIASLFLSIPNELSPKEDRNLAGVFIPLSSAKSLDDLENDARSVESLLQSSVKEAEHCLVFLGGWGGQIVLPLLPKLQRNRSAADIAMSFRGILKGIPSIEAYPWSWDSGLPGLSVGGGGNSSELSLIVSTTEDYRSLFNSMEKIKQLVEKVDGFGDAHHNLKLDTMKYEIDVNRNDLSRVGLSMEQVAKTIEVFFSNDQSLNFSKDGILYDITLRGQKYPWSLAELYLTNANHQHISLSAVAKMKQISNPKSLTHYNQMRSAILTVDIKKKADFAQSMKKLADIVQKNIPVSYKKSWTGAAKVYLESSMTLLILFCLAIIFIFAILAIQFESFVDPFIILLTVPLSCLGALLMMWCFNQSLNVYTQVGLITLVGLVTKHGILIVEFANQIMHSGVSVVAAVLRASALRLRPILMTTAAMIFGMVPLVLAHSAGSECRCAIAIVLIGGLALGTLFTLFVLPTIYVIVKSLGSGKA